MRIRNRFISGIVSAAMVIGLIWFVRPVSRAAVVPYFVAVNDTVLPFNENTMPLHSNGHYFIPHNVLVSAGVHYLVNIPDETVQLYRGDRTVNFYTIQNHTTDQDERILNWPSARRVGSRFYVPLAQVAAFFGLTYEIIEIGHDIIPYDHVSIIRIQPDPMLNGPSFVGLHRSALRTTYLRHLASQQATLPPTGTDEDTPPDFRDTTIYLSFFDLSAGGLKDILDLLDSPAATGFNATFFASAADIVENPGLIRRIFGSGHSLGIRLIEGTFEEYLEASALLFEAASVRSVLISAYSDNENAIDTAQEHVLLLWDSPQSFGENDTAPRVINAISRDSNTRQNLKFNASENTALLLPGVFTFLRTNNYTVQRITETVLPPMRQGG
ncbi:MAG: hypothetical protein FWC90_08170 [Oscillospiraceae bacterium]|nr:hypothetical protein [Oscillospiraceae bacterium]